MRVSSRGKGKDARFVHQIPLTLHPVRNRENQQIIFRKEK
jgi:hypothetical protein